MAKKPLPKSRYNGVSARMHVTTVSIPNQDGTLSEWATEVFEDFPNQPVPMDVLKVIVSEWLENLVESKTTALPVGRSRKPVVDVAPDPVMDEEIEALRERVQNVLDNFDGEGGIRAFKDLLYAAIHDVDPDDEGEDF
jgi:hypothetical protein